MPYIVVFTDIIDVYFLIIQADFIAIYMLFDCISVIKSKHPPFRTGDELKSPLEGGQHIFIALLLGDLVV